MKFKTTLICMVSACSIAFVFGDAATLDGTKPDREALTKGLTRAGAKSGNKDNPIASEDGGKSRSRAEYIKSVGGIVHVPPSGAPLVVVDATTKQLVSSPFAEVNKVLAEYEMVATRLEANTNGLAFVDGYAWVKSRFQDAAGVILVVDGDAHDPVMATYPEDRVAVVSASALLSGAEGTGSRENRLVRGLWRAIGFTFGSGYATQFECVMKPIGSVQELDSLKLRFIHPVTANNMQAAFRKAGAIAAKHGTYLQAVRGGWAPPPTNDVQKAIWAENHKSRK